MHKAVGVLADPDFTLVDRIIDLIAQSKDPLGGLSDPRTSCSNKRDLEITEVMRVSLLPSELLGVLLASSYFTARHAFAGPTVNVALQASFNAPPYILELLLVTQNSDATLHGRTNSV